MVQGDDSQQNPSALLHKELAEQAQLAEARYKGQPVQAAKLKGYKALVFKLKAAGC